MIEYKSSHFGLDPELESRIPFHFLRIGDVLRGMKYGRGLYYEEKRMGDYAYKLFVGATFVSEEGGIITYNRGGKEYTCKILENGSFELNAPHPWMGILLRRDTINTEEAKENVSKVIYELVEPKEDEITSCIPYFEVSKSADNQVNFDAEIFFEQIPVSDAFRTFDKADVTVKVMSGPRKSYLQAEVFHLKVGVELTYEEALDLLTEEVQNYTFNKNNRYNMIMLTVNSGGKSSSYEMNVTDLIK